MGHRVERRLRGEAEDVVVERTRLQLPTGHLDESRHPVVDELLATFVESGVGAPEAGRLAGGGLGLWAAGAGDALKGSESQEEEDSTRRDGRGDRMGTPSPAAYGPVPLQSRHSTV